MDWVKLGGVLAGVIRCSWLIRTVKNGLQEKASRMWISMLWKWLAGAARWMDENGES